MSMQPAWWQVTGIGIGAAILLWWEGRAALAAPLHQYLLLALILLVHGLIAWWLQANQVALEREDWQRARPERPGVSRS